MLIKQNKENLKKLGSIGTNILAQIYFIIKNEEIKSITITLNFPKEKDLENTQYSCQVLCEWSLRSENMHATISTSRASPPVLGG